MASQYSGSHNSYRGPLLAKIDLSQVTAIDAPHFALIALSEYLHWGTDYGGRSIIEPHRPRELTANTIIALQQAPYQPFLFRSLSGLTVCFIVGEVEFLVSNFPRQAVNLRRLSLQDVHWPLTHLVQPVVASLTTAKGEQGVTTTSINDRLEELRVAWQYHGRSPIEAVTSGVRFSALTRLHLVNSTLLHR